MPDQSRVALERALVQAEATVATLRAALAGAKATEDEHVFVGAAAQLAGADKETIRRWCRLHGIGHQVGGPRGPWRISLSKLQTLLDGR